MAALNAADAKSRGKSGDTVASAMPPIGEHTEQNIHKRKPSG